MIKKERWLATSKIHFDEPGAAFHPFYLGHAAVIGPGRKPCKDSMVYATSTQNCSRACRGKRPEILGRTPSIETRLHALQRGVPDAHSTPQYAIIASCDVAGRDDGATGRRRLEKRASAKRSTSAARWRRWMTARTGGSRPKHQV